MSLRASERSVIAVKPSISVNRAVISRDSPSSLVSIGIFRHLSDDGRREMLLEALTQRSRALFVVRVGRQ